ncbi:MAG: A/G-specific adenine glycosylase [Dialister sp.]|nr:A/G-specific adenine glycosylase [Dialister sp.]
MKGQDKTTWQERLLFWYRRHDRELPWRQGTPDPYRVWVSEIMLQQTRAEAVKPYYASWMGRFPSLEALAAADEDEVLHAWQGLGYYSRARNLHRAAREIHETYGGRLPEDIKKLRALPGIGDYTAGAIASIAFGQKEAAIDGNVLRVYARLFAVEEDILKTAGRKQIRRLVEDTLPEEAGDFNAALMDLGADVCIPKRPRCGECPLTDVCLAFQNRRTDELPVRGEKKAPQVYEAACGLCIKGGKILMHRRSPKGMLASMWEFPMMLADSANEARDGLSRLLAGAAELRLWTHTHVFTHQVWHMKAYGMEHFSVPEGYVFFDGNELLTIPLAGPHARLAAWVKAGNILK